MARLNCRRTIKSDSTRIVSNAAKRSDFSGGSSAWLTRHIGARDLRLKRICAEAFAILQDFRLRASWC
jgi:hypothetical protein